MIPHDSDDNSITARLLAWYHTSRRILPWREDPTPYHVWLSETMLQQTRVEAVIGYYERFLHVLPDIASLAAASEDTCLKLWEGLGYYSRVRNLHKAAQVVMDQYHGKLPSTTSELKKLPGIGDYTAAAIASIAFGEPVPAVDGNFLRVFARYTRYTDNIRTDAAKKAATSFYTDNISQDQPGDFNQAVMDLGAMICLPGGTPLCLQCPLQTACRIHQELPGQEASLPVMPEKKKRPVTKLTVLLIHLLPASMETVPPGGSVQPSSIETVPAAASVQPSSVETVPAAASVQTSSAEAAPAAASAQAAPFDTRSVPAAEERILIRRRPDTGLLAGLYEFPQVEGWLTERQLPAALPSLGLEDISIQRIEKLPAAKHVFTHREWHMHGYELWLSGRNSSLIAASRQEIALQYSIPSAYAVYEKILLSERNTLRIQQSV